MTSRQQRESAQRTLSREVGYVRKPHANRLRVALAFPNTYFVGMSNLGFQTVYRLFNHHPDVVCERVFLPPPVREHLGRFLAGRAEGLVFGRADGGGITTRQARRRLRQWLERSGAEPSSPHALRHAFAMRLYRRTRDLLLVRRALGHASVASSLRYARVEDEELRAAMIG